MEKVKKGYVIMAGDFNMVTDKIKDKTFNGWNDIYQRNTILRKKTRNNQLKDTWRELKGDKRRYTYFSAVHNSYSRIEFIFTSQDLIFKIINTEINSIKITDPALMSIETEIKRL